MRRALASSLLLFPLACSFGPRVPDSSANGACGCGSPRAQHLDESTLRTGAVTRLVLAESGDVSSFLRSSTDADTLLIDVAPLAFEIPAELGDAATDAAADADATDADAADAGPDADADADADAGTTLLSTIGKVTGALRRPDEVAGADGMTLVQLVVCRTIAERLRGETCIDVQGNERAAEHLEVPATFEKRPAIHGIAVTVDSARLALTTSVTVTPASDVTTCE